MKKFIKLLLILILPVFVLAQTEQKQLNDLHLALKNAANDTIRMDVYLQLGSYYSEINRDSSLFYYEHSLPIALKLKLKLYEAIVLANHRAYILLVMGNYPKSLESLLQALKIAEDPTSENIVWKLPWYLSRGQTPRNARIDVLANTYHILGHLHGRTGNREKQISSYLLAISLADSIQDTGLNAVASNVLGGVYFNLNKLDSALLFEKKALTLFSKLEPDQRKYEGAAFTNIGNVYHKKGNYNLSMDAFLNAEKINKEHNNLIGLGQVYISLSSLYQTINKPESSLMYATKALETYKIVGQSRGIADAYFSLSSVYEEQERTKNAFVYLKLATAIRDSLNNVERKNLLAYQNLGFNEILRLKKLEDERIQTQTKIRTYAMLSGIAVFMFIAFLLYRNNRNRRRANTLLQKQKAEIAEQKENVEQTLIELKSTQSQLIQSEKMASLGELTAGIAHEIQNPLNFVNNFSELSEELMDELVEEIKNNSETGIEEIIADIKQNLNKINNHGKRASGIVKGMLDHSRTTSGEKVLTDINILADEYLRLSYHGLRAKDKSFNAGFITEFDSSIPKISIVPQDFGRAILNLINNAFYSVNKKAKELKEGYLPMVTIGTKKIEGAIKISIKDNGEGIPREITDKIFQPFFTTKPTGEGTGLGLSLAYDIVSKGYGGKLNVISEKGSFTEFTIILPVKNRE